MDRYIIRQKDSPESPAPPEKKLKTHLEESKPKVNPGTSAASTAITESEESDCEIENLDTARETGKLLKKKRYNQKFKVEWVKRFGSWLTHTTDPRTKTEAPFCSVCNHILKGGITHIERHSKTSSHCTNWKLAKARPSTTIDKLLTSPKEDTLSKQIKAAELKMIMFLAEHNLPFSLLDHLGKFLASACPDSSVAKSIQCQRKKGTNLCVNVIAPDQLQSVIKDMNVNFFSIIVDETTDVSTVKSLVLVARYYKNYKVVDRYLSLIKVEDGSSQNLYNSIMNLFEKCHINYCNMLGLGADNASVMQGNKTGLRAKFTKLVPHLFVLGCTCHSLNLCSSAACSKLPKNVEKFCRDVCNYFAHSSTRTGKLTEFQEFCQTEIHHIIKISKTRWLSMQNVVARILEQWQPLILFFTAESSEHASTNKSNVDRDNADLILSALKNPIFKLYFLFLNYSLDLINKLNIEFQSEGLKVQHLLERITAVYKIIIQNFIKKDCVKNDLNDLDVANPRNFLPLENIYFGAQCEMFVLQNDIDRSDLHNFRLRCLDFYTELAKQIKSRFDFKDEVLSFAKVLNPTVVFSDEFPSLIPIVHRFPVLCESKYLENVNTEWRLLRESKDSFNYDSVEDFWRQVFLHRNGLDEPMFPCIKNIITGLMCLPHSSAAAERIFSQLNLIKTKHRNRLRMETCDSLIHTKEMLRCSDSKCYNFKPPDSLLCQNLPPTVGSAAGEVDAIDLTF